MQFVSSMECIQNNRHSNKQTADHGRNPLTGGSLANATAIRSPPGCHHFIPIDPLPFLPWCGPMIMSLPQSFPWSAGSHKSGDTRKKERKTHTGAQPCRKFLLRWGLLGLRVRGKGQSLTFGEQLQHLVWSEMGPSQCRELCLCVDTLGMHGLSETRTIWKTFSLYIYRLASPMIQSAYLKKGFPWALSLTAQFLKCHSKIWPCVKGSQLQCVSRIHIQLGYTFSCDKSRRELLQAFVRSHRGRGRRRKEGRKQLWAWLTLKSEW